MLPVGVEEVSSGVGDRPFIVPGAADRPLALPAGIEELVLGAADRPLTVILGVEELMLDVVDRPLTLLAGVEDWSRFSSEDITSADIPIIPLTGAEDPGLGAAEEDGAAVVESPLTLVGGAELDTPITLGTPPPVTPVFPPRT